MDYKKAIIAFLGIIVLITSFLLIQSHISSQVDLAIKDEREKQAKILADKTIELENKRIEAENKLKNDVITLQTQLETCKLQLEEASKKKELKELSKKNPAKFRETVDRILGTKGKKNK